MVSPTPCLCMKVCREENGCYVSHRLTSVHYLLLPGLVVKNGINRMDIAGRDVTEYLQVRPGCLQAGRLAGVSHTCPSIVLFCL
jgi:hypothetical protein